MRKVGKGLRRAKFCVSIRRALLCAIQLAGTQGEQRAGGAQFIRAGRPCHIRGLERWGVSIIMAAGPGGCSCDILWTQEAWIPISPAAQCLNWMVMNG